MVKYMKQNNERFIGLRGTGNETEYDIVLETDKAYRLKADDGFTFWMPKSAFEEDGSIRRTYYWMLDEKYALRGKT